jgi:hypothetical protein
MKREGHGGNTTGTTVVAIRAASRQIRDRRILLIIGLRGRAVIRPLAAEWDRAPLTTALTLLSLVVAVALGAHRLAAFAARSDTAALGVAAGTLALLIAWHATRRDTWFLRHVGIAPQVVYAAEYALAVSAVVALLAWCGRWPAALLAVSGAAAIALLPPRRRATFDRRGWRVPLRRAPNAFEWIGALRRNRVPMLGVGVLTLIGLTSARDAGWPCVGAVGILALIGVDAYLRPPAEGWLLVHVGARSPDAFLARKLVLAVLPFLLLAAVPVSTLVVANPTTTRLATGLVAMAAGAAAIGSALLLKYAVYQEGRRPPPLVVTIVACAWGLSLSMFAPLMLVLAALLWRRAARRTSAYLAPVGSAARTAVVVKTAGNGAP